MKMYNIIDLHATSTKPQHFISQNEDAAYLSYLSMC